MSSYNVLQITDCMLWPKWTYFILNQVLFFFLLWYNIIFLFWFWFLYSVLYTKIWITFCTRKEKNNEGQYCKVQERKKFKWWRFSHQYNTIWKELLSKNLHFTVKVQSKLHHGLNSTVTFYNMIQDCGTEVRKIFILHLLPEHGG